MLRTCYSRIFLTILSVFLLVGTALAADYTAETLSALYGVLLENMQAQRETFTVDYHGDHAALLDADGSLNAIELIHKMCVESEPEAGADLAMLNLTEGQAGILGDILYFRFQYLQTPEQLAFVAARADEIVAELSLSDKRDYLKIKAIYNYMGTHFSYDKSLTKFTDYEGLTSGEMVCQGYALLTYRLMWKAGIPCRIVVGVSQNQSHGWNLVKLDGAWYNLDTTWDASDNGITAYWDYFLKNEADFIGHVRDATFQSAGFCARFPMAEASYPAPYSEILIGGEDVSMLTIRNGVTLQLDAVLSPENNGGVVWHSTNPEAVHIAPDGIITSLTPGELSVIAAPLDENYLPAALPVVAVDLRTCSPWASDALNSFYLRKYYPYTLCSDYTNAITRAEFSVLVYNIISPYLGSGSFHAPDFQDLSECKEWAYILYCTTRGIFDGTSETTFSPDAPVTRQQAAKILCRMLEKLEVPVAAGEISVPADLSLAEPWAQENIRTILQTGILQGFGDSFHPWEALTREQAAVALERMVANFLPEPPIQEAA